MSTSSAAFRPAMYPWQTARPRPCCEKPPADSPPQYSPSMTLPFTSMTWHLALMRKPARVSWTTGVAHAA